MSLLSEIRRRNVARVAAAYVAVSWLIIQVVEALFPMFGLSDGTARVVVILLAIGLIPVLIFSWIFELTPEGFKRDSEVDHASDDSRKLARRLDRLIIVVLVVALGYFAIDKFVIDPARDQAREQEVAQQARDDALVESYGDHSIAVLPFDDMSPGGDQEYFSDGISEELLNLLAKIPELRVISRSSAFSFKGQDIHIPTVAEKLNVAHILEGSVRKSGDRIRITAQLIDARTDTHLWSETYDRTLDDIFAIQDEVAAKVVDQLHVTLLGQMPRATPVDTQAYNLYLKARHIASLHLVDQLDEALTLARQVTEIEPDFVDGWILLSMVAGLNQYGFFQERREEMVALAAEARDRVIAIDPENPTALAWIAQEAGNPAKAAELLERAARVDPTAIRVNWAAIQLALEIGNLPLAIEISEYLVVRDPLLFWGHLNLAGYYFDAGRTDEAMERYEIALSLNDSDGEVRWKYGLAKMMNGDPDGALEQFELEPGDGYQMMGFAAVYHDLGRFEESEQAFAELIENGGENWPWGIARAYAWIGDADTAFYWLERTRALDPNYLNGMERNRLLEKLRDDPRWLPFLRSVGRAPDQIPEAEFNFKVPG